MKRDCSGHGRYFSDRCLCNGRFVGAECQYENECEKDEDCEGRFGKCVDLEATSYPKKQCFCSQGAYGHKCSKRESFCSRSSDRRCASALLAVTLVPFTLRRVPSALRNADQSRHIHDAGTLG